MRRSGLFVVLALVTALGCKQTGPGTIGGALDIYTQLDAGPITGMNFSFGTACPNFPVTQQFYIVNTGTPPVTISSVTLNSTSPFSLVPPVVAANTDVEPGNNVPQTVQFNPTSMGPQPGATMTVATIGAFNDGGPANYSINLSGNGSNGPAVATISTTCGGNTPCGSINFGQTAVGSPSKMPITVSNTGCPSLTLAVSFTFTLPDGGTSLTGHDGGASPYSLVTPAPAMVNFGNAANLEVQYAPTVGGAADFWNLVLTTNDATNPITTIPLTGTSTELKITFQTPSECPLPISIGNNGQVYVGTTTVVPYTMINNGSLQVKLGVPFIEDGGVGYSVTNAWTAPITLDGGDTASFDVSFTSPGAGLFIGTVDVPVIGGMDNSCQMQARSIGNICAPDGGIPQQTVILPPPTDPTLQLCQFSQAQVVLYNCGSAPIDFCGIDAGTANPYYIIDAGPFGELPPDASFTIDVSFTDPGVLQSPWIWTFNICNDAQGYANTDAGGGGFQLTVEATTFPVPVQNPSTPPVVLSGLDDAGVNPVDGREMHLLAVLPDAGLGDFYQYVWTAAAVGSNFVNVCGDAGFGLWYVDGGLDGGPGIGNNFGGEAYVTPVGWWVPGDTHVNQCKICVFAYEVDAGNGNCGFDGGWSPTNLHCFGPVTVLDGG